MAFDKSKKEIALIKKEDLLYPSLLKEINGPPSGIYLLGKLPSEEKTMLAIVGTRKATSAGEATARQIARELGEAGMVIVSGLAMGIDTAAHEGALEAETETIAVLANGLDTIYPRQNENLANRIIEARGAIISEYPAGTPAFPNQFLDRNRIISGLSIAAIIIEAPLRSGVLVTARLAAEQGREVFVFPGPGNHPNYRGSHKLIRDGARLVTSSQDILEDLGMEADEEKLKHQLGLGLDSGAIKDEEKIILEIIKRAGEPLNVDKITELSKLETQVVNRALAFLSINNIIKETERGYSI